uniref:Uncharacterized protein n=1 Tax=Globodera rostochiensis TaxID=31243 RepID=A0A914HMC7_GLORO
MNRSLWMIYAVFLKPRNHWIYCFPNNCNKLLEHSVLEGNKNYWKSLLSKIRSIAKEIEKEFMTFIIEVELELIIKKVKWTSNYSRIVLEKKLAYCDSTSFINAWSWTHRIEKTNPPQNQKEFVEEIEKLIVDTKLNILKNELHAKIAVFAQQPHIDGDGFMEFSYNFKNEWDKIKQKIDQLTRNDVEKKTYFRGELDFLAKSAMLETVQLKAIITKKLDKLCPGPKKNFFKKLGQSFKNDQKKQKEQKEEAKKKEIDAMKEIINDIGIFDGAAYKLLVRFEHEELDNDDFCAELETAVEQDKKMVLQAYQVKNLKQ